MQINDTKYSQSSYLYFALREISYGWIHPATVKICYFWWEVNKNPPRCNDQWTLSTEHMVILYPGCALQCNLSSTVLYDSTYTKFIFTKLVVIREAFKKKKSQKAEKIQKGGGVSAGDQKVHNSKCGLFNKRGGRPNFRFFPKCKCRLQSNKI